MTSVELASFDGRDDVSSSTRWTSGNHEGVHQAGQDLTEALKSAPHVRTVIERFPTVGRLETPVPAVSTARKNPIALILAVAVLLLILLAIFR